MVWRPMELSTGVAMIDDIRKADIVELSESGFNGAEIGRLYGVTRERIRQILMEKDVPPARERQAQRIKEQQLAGLVERLKAAKPCVVCGCWVIRPQTGSRPVLTCSVECSKAYRHLRYHIDRSFHNRRQLATARWIAAHADRVSRATYWHAVKVLNGEPTAYHGRWTNEGSYVSELIDKYGLREKLGLEGGETDG